jgi:hypothetical protein
MSADSLIRSRRSLARGVGTTTRRNRRLSGDPDLQPIPARVGVFEQLEPIVSIPEPDCLGSNWWSYLSGFTWYPRAWHTALDTLVSSDGVIRMDRQAHKRISFSGFKPSLSSNPIHLCFSSQTVAASPEPGADSSDYQMIETGYANREWHPLQTVMVFPLGMIGAAQRLKSIEMQQYGTGYKFRWSFKTPADAAITGVTPTCLNRPANETRTADRVFNNSGTAQPRRRLTKFALVTQDGQKGEVELRSAPWGFLPATSFVHVALLEMNIAASESNQLNMTDLSRLLSIGQPYHGVCTPTGIQSLAGATLPKPAAPSSYSAPQYSTTRYFKNPMAPGVPASGLLPPDYASAGYEFRDDVIFAGGIQYGPVGTAMLPPTPTSWMHVNTAGECRILSLVLVSDTTTTTTWDLVRWDQKPGESLFSYTVLQRIAITTTDAVLTAIAQTTITVRTYTGSVDFQQSVSLTGVPQNPPTRESTFNLWLNKLWHVESSPDGRKIAVMRGMFNPQASYNVAAQKSCIATVATFEIDGYYTVTGPVYEWQYEHTYAQNADYTLNHCLGFAFKPDGQLFKWLMSETFEARGLIDVDGGPAEYWQYLHKLTDVSYNATQVEPYVAPWPPGYSVNLNSEKLFTPYSTPFNRLSNNVLMQVVTYQDSDGDPALLVELSAPSGPVDYYATMPAGVGTAGRAVSWNPKTGEIAARTNSGVISWI